MKTICEKDNRVNELYRHYEKLKKKYGTQKRDAHLYKLFNHISNAN